MRENIQLEWEWCNRELDKYLSFWSSEYKFSWLVHGEMLLFLFLLEQVSTTLKLYRLANANDNDYDDVCDDYDDDYDDYDLIESILKSSICQIESTSCCCCCCCCCKNNCLKGIAVGLKQNCMISYIYSYPREIMEIIEVLHEVQLTCNKHLSRIWRKREVWTTIKLSPLLRVDMMDVHSIKCLG